MTAHPPAPTPTPWTLLWHGNEKYPYPLSVMSQDGTGWVARDGQVSSEANARLIVTAVNAHAPLVEACRAAEAALRIVLDAEAFPELGTPYNIAKSEASEALPVVRAALQKAGAAE